MTCQTLSVAGCATGSLDRTFASSGGESHAGAEPEPDPCQPGAEKRQRLTGWHFDPEDRYSGCEEDHADQWEVVQRTFSDDRPECNGGDYRPADFWQVEQPDVNRAVAPGQDTG